MQARILDLDGSLLRQPQLIARCQPRIFAARQWGPSIRLACRFGRFHRFERDLATLFGDTKETQPAITFYGSGDFHHVSLALVRRLATPVNLLVLDNHPDWMRGVPFLHCGTWLYHAARLPTVKRIFHVGGDVDFDNYYQWMAPWRLLRSGKILVFPGIRRFQRGLWASISHKSVRSRPDAATRREQMEELVCPFHTELASLPLYISLDKDVLRVQDAIVNWDSGRLTLAEVCELLQVFMDAARGNMAGVDIVGDWSPVRLRGWLPHVMHWTEHPSLTVDANEAARRNEQANLALLQALRTPVARPSSDCGPHLPHSSTPRSRPANPAFDRP
jgi:hypothetical protein